MKTTNPAIRALTALPIFAALLAGCLADAGPGDGEDEAQNHNAIGTSNVHIMPVQHVSQGAILTTSAPAGAKLTYYGGPVISTVKIYTIFWGASVNYSTQLNAFYTGVTNSPHFDWLNEYNTSSQSIGRGTFAGSYADTTAPTGSVTDAQIQSEINKLITGGKIPAPDANTLYMVHFAPGISISDPSGSKSCQTFCAYHGTYTRSGQYVYYGVIPDQGGSCAGGCGSDPVAFNNLTSVASHEMIEAVTDPAVGLATANASPLAWYDTVNGEIGDICNAQQGTVLGGNGVTYTVQAEYSNAAKNCIVTKAGTGGTGGSTGGTCAHPICTSGTKLTATCDPCATKVCAADAYCCSPSWDSQCVSEVASICGQSCSGGTGGTGGSGGTGGTGGSGGTGGTGGTCAHAVCTAGTKLTASCDACATKICAADSYCCTTKWDSQCVKEVGTICGKTCP